ncbi:YDG domain-containing protein [Rufibacter glacialis]
MSGRKYRVVLSACTPSQTTTSDAADLIVTPQNLRATSLVASKEYNGSPAPGTVSLGAVTGMVGTETLTITPQASNFSDANVGSAKATTITYILADGANGGKASNYAMAPFATTGEINPKPVLVTPIPNQSKVYGTPEPTFTFGNNAGLGESAFGTTKLARTPGEDVNTYSYSLGNLSAGTNYSLSLDGSNKFAITAKDITGTFASANKIYDGNPDAAATNRQLIGVIGSDAVTLNGGTATFADKNVGEAKTVTLSDATLAGAAAGNYRLATVNSTSASIGAKSLTAASTVASKVYNGSAAAGSVTLGTVSGLVDSETLAIIPTASNYVDANVGTTKATSISYTLANGTNGGLAANYSMAPLAASGEITAKQVTVVPNALTKVYGEEDQAFTYTLSEQPLAGITLSGALGREPGNNVGTYAYTLGSLSAGINYSLNLTNASPLATFAITAKEVSASFTADNKEYDGNATAVVLTRALAGVLSADASNVSLGTSGTASFASAAAGNGKTVTATGLTLTGPAAGNYRLATATATTTANITPKAITVTPIAGQTKVYGAADPTFTYTASESLLTGNSFSGNLAREAGAGVGQYAYTLGSLTAGTNYSLSLLGGGNKFAITAKEVTGSFLAASKTYDGTADATVTARSLGGLVGSDAVTLTGGTAAFADKNVGTGKTVTLTGAALAGAAAGNYTLAAVNTATANITAKDITGTFASATKVYDGNTNAAASNRQLVGVEGTDAVTLSGGTAAFSDKNVASGKTVTLSGAALAGVQAANYRLTSVATALADITSKDLVISISAQDKVYDGNASAVVSASITNGLVTGDKVTVSASNGLFNDKNAGTAKGISATVSKSGDDAGNYLANATASTSATINQKALTASSTVASKVYDGSAATGTVSLGVVTGLVNSETLVITPVAANFENANVGAAKATSISYVLANGTEGGLAANYSMASIAASGAITAKLISGSFTASDKVYDGLANAMVTGRSLNGVIPTDAASVSLTGGSAAFSDKNVANNKTVTLTGASLAGTGVGNYSLTSIATTTATITTRDLMVNATGKDKVYDGTTTATATLNDNRVAGDALNIGYASASFSDPTVGTNKAVVINGIAITGGADAGNYTLPNPTTSTTAQITKASTTTTLVTSAGQVRFMDNLTMTAKITPLNTGSALTGSVEFKIGSVIYGTVAVVPVPGSSDGSVQATLIKQVAELPSNYNLTATFSATNSNYSGSNGSKALTVTPRDASARDVNAGFYTGDVFAWTTSSTSSKATVTLIASLKDVNTPTGDLRAAKVTFYYVNGTTLTPIPSAKDLPVGLVDVNDGSVGFATATVQFDIGSNNAMDYQVAVGVSGAYTNQPSTAQAIITVSKPVPGGFIVGGSQMTNKNSNGYLKGQEGMNTDYQFDIQYTKSGTSPKGKAKVMIRSYYKPDGTLDSKLHTYLITTNAIATLNITKAPDGSATGNFSAKANIVEQLDDLSIVAIEGGSTFQMEAYQRNCDQQVAITLFRKAGGIWFSSNWTGSNTVKQQVNATSKVFVEGGGTMACSTPTTPVATTSKAVIATAPEKAAKAEPKLTSYPNPLTDEATVEFSVTQNEEYSLDVYDMKGALVKHLQKGKAGSSETITATWNARTSNVGVYIIRLSTSNKVKTLRVMRQ